MRHALTRWRPRDASTRRETTALALNLLPAIVAVAGFALLRPPADWSDPLMIASLCAISGVAYLAEARLRFGVLAFYGATFVAAFVALAVAGALPALLVWIVPDVIARYVLRREPRFSPGLIATVSSYALALLAGAGLLALAGNPTGPESAPTLYAAGIAMWSINFLFARLTFAPFYQGIPPSTLVRDEFSALAPTALAMLVVGVLSALLVEAIGIPALALLAAVICLPQLILERLVSSAPAAQLSRAAATQLYCDAIADVMQLSPGVRRELACASGLVDGQGAAGARGVDPARAGFIALHSHERWAGNGWPAGLPAEAIPVESRVLAVAVAWSDLTSSGTPELSQADAVLALEAQSGLAFDPAVVAAAEQVVEDEAGFAIEPAFQPKLHRLPGPRALRRGALPSLLPRPTSA